MSKVLSSRFSVLSDNDSDCLDLSNIEHIRKVDDAYPHKLIRTVRGVGYCVSDEAEP